VLEQRKTILKVLLNCVSSQKNKFMVLDKRKYRIGIFTELCLTHAQQTEALPCDVVLMYSCVCALQSSGMCTTETETSALSLHPLHLPAQVASHINREYSRWGGAQLFFF